MITGLPRMTKPSSLEEYDRIKAAALLANETQPLDLSFVTEVTTKGLPFYGYTQDAFGEWKSQTLVGLDFDDCPLDPADTVRHYKRLGFNPWFAYTTFGGTGNYRIIFKCAEGEWEESQWKSFIRIFSYFAGQCVDLAACNPRRFWQGVYGEGNLFYLAKEGCETLLTPTLFNFQPKAVRQQGKFL